MDFITHAIANADRYLLAASTVVAAASAVTALTPTPRDDTWLGRVYKMLEVAALVVGHAKDPGPGTPRAGTRPKSNR